VKPRLSSYLSSRGATLLGGSLALGLIGLVFIDGFLITLGTSGLLVLAGAFLAGRANLAKLALRIDAPQNVSAGTVFPLTLSLHNPRGLLDAFGVHIEISLPGDTKLSAYAAWIPAG